MRFEIDWASVIVGSKFTIFALFYFVICGQFSKYKPPEGLYLEGRFNRGFFVLPVWGAYIWRGLYMVTLIFGILRYVGKSSSSLYYLSIFLAAQSQPSHNKTQQM